MKLVEENSRTKKSIKNLVYAVGTKMIIMIMSFALRTVFVRTLGQQYLGINGLFSNIITMLSLADLGIGIAIPYTLYSPLAKKDTERIKVLMKFYSQMYNVIGITVLLVGLVLTPFLHIFVKEMPNIPNIQLIYLLFVLSSSMSYFFVYKKMLMDSDQKGYISSKIIMRVTLIANIIQMILLLITKNYLLYLCLNIVSVLIQNIAISIKCNSVYPYIKEKTNEKIKKKDVRELTRNIYALCIYKIGVVILNGTDNIIISKLIGVVEVGLYSNYLLIVNSLNGIVSQVFSSITSSIGNMVVTDKKEKSEFILRKLQFFNFWIYSVCSICLFILVNKFIELWIGKDYCLSEFVAFLIALNFFVYGMQSVVSSFRDAYGLFVQGKYRPVVMVIVNIILSIILTQKIGIAGVIIGTIVSRIAVTGIWDPIVVYRYGFKMKSRRYFLSYYGYLAMYLIVESLIWYIIKKIHVENLLILVFVAILTFAASNIMLLLIYKKTENFKFFYEKIKSIVKGKLGVSNNE